MTGGNLQISCNDNGGFMKENWKPLIYKDIDMSDRFLISDNGNIYSLKSKKVLKQTLNKSTGYYAVCVSLGSRSDRKLIKTHIAVATNFVDGYKHGLVVNHKDGNKKNNNASNLEWVTHKQNSIHASKNGLLHGKTGCDVYNSKISESDVRNIREMLKNGEKQCDIAKKYSVSRDVVYHIAHNQTYKNVV